MVIGLLLANFSLSSGIYTQIYDIWFSDVSVANFLIFLGLAMGAVCLISYPSTHLMTEKRTTNVDTYPYVAGMTYTNILAIVVGTFASSMAMHQFVVGMYLLFIMVSIYLGVLMVQRFGDRVYKFDVILDDDGLELHGVESTAAFGSGGGDIPGGSGDGGGSGSGGDVEKPTLVKKDGSTERDKLLGTGDMDRADSLTLMEALKTPDFWMLFFCFMAGVSCGITTLDNMSEIVDSHAEADADDGTHSDMKTAAVALFSACNSAGRILYGALSDKLSRHVNKTQLLLFNCCLMIVSMLFFAWVTMDTIYIATVMCAVAYGGFWALVPALVAEFFGPAAYGSIQGLMGLAATIGTEVFYNIMSVDLYDTYTDDGGSCFGNALCFRYTFVILACLCSLALFVAVFMARRHERALQLGIAPTATPGGGF
mmetsp:Transcript_26013/g.60930  ORF Transcript_26013/g.60930 Transcript_26013/m.60930 type:complete len:425 (-) Transcript_26013:94-1368(-)